MADVKVGAGHADAMFRAGHKELGQALVAFPHGTIRPVEEPGLLGNLTPQEVIATKQNHEARLDQAAARDNGIRTTPSLER